RHRMNHVNPAPLEEVRQRWMHGFAETAGRQAVALKRHLENQGAHEMTTTETPTSRATSVRVESELRVEAPPARVFTALTAEQHAWYPYNYGGERVRDIVFEPRVGGAVFEDWGDGAGHHYGTVTHYDTPTAVTIRGGLPGGTVLENVFHLEADGDATVVRHSMTAFGDLSDDDLAGIRSHGDMSLFEPQLRAWVEKGKRAR
ncbi:MAG TPA: hypothetical protein VM030_04455, partial [Acidimicrobiales bacterium]|nr:hypothetical protein [Acidimicrobiales bacterium]